MTTFASELSTTDGRALPKDLEQNWRLGEEHPSGPRGDTVIETVEFNGLNDIALYLRRSGTNRTGITSCVPNEPSDRLSTTFST